MKDKYFFVHFSFLLRRKKKSEPKRKTRQFTATPSAPQQTAHAVICVFANQFPSLIGEKMSDWTGKGNSLCKNLSARLKLRRALDILYTLNEPFLGSHNKFDLYVVSNHCLRHNFKAEFV